MCEEGTLHLGALAAQHSHNSCELVPAGWYEGRR